MQVRRKDDGGRGGWRSDFVGPGVLLDKYREKQRHGGSNENENKGALRNYGSAAPWRRGAAGRCRGNRDTFATHDAERDSPKTRGKSRQKEANDAGAGWSAWMVLSARIPLIAPPIHATLQS